MSGEQVRLCATAAVQPRRYALHYTLRYALDTNRRLRPLAVVTAAAAAVTPAIAPDLCTSPAAAAGPPARGSAALPLPLLLLRLHLRPLLLLLPLLRRHPLLLLLPVLLLLLLVPLLLLLPQLPRAQSILLLHAIPSPLLLPCRSQDATRCPMSKSVTKSVDIRTISHTLKPQLP